jgi:hypothetical protein
MTIVRIAKDWDWPDIMRQTPGGQGVWSGIQFTTEDVSVCDLVVVLNNRMKQTIQTHCPDGNVWALMQEPYVPGVTDWMIEGHEAFDKIYTNYIPSQNQKYIRQQPAIPWHVNRSFDELTACQMPAKISPISWIVGNINDLPGHLARREFLRLLRESDLNIHLFGRAAQPIEDKWDGLAPYKYSIAAENTEADDYWTEKLADCFLSWTVPFYHGAPNIDEYFPQDSYVRIDLKKPAEAIEIIYKELSTNNWEKRLPAIIEARRRILYEFQFFPQFVKQLEQYQQKGSANQKTIPAYKRSFRAKIRRILHKIEMKWLRNTKNIYFTS